MDYNNSQSGTDISSLNRRSKLERQEQRQTFAHILRSHSKDLEEGNARLELGTRKISLFDINNPVADHEENDLIQTNQSDAPAETIIYASLQETHLRQESREAEPSLPTESDQKFRNKYLVIADITDLRSNSLASAEKARSST